MDADKDYNNKELETPVSRRDRRKNRSKSTKLMLSLVGMVALFAVSTGPTVANWTDTESGGLGLFGFETCEAPRVEVDDSTWNYGATHPDGERLPNMPDFQIQGTSTDATAVRVEPSAPDDSFGGSDGSPTNNEGAFESENSFLSLGEDGVTLAVSNPAESCGAVYVNSPRVTDQVSPRDTGVYAYVLSDLTSVDGADTYEIRETQLYRDSRVQTRGQAEDPDSDVTLIDGQPVEYNEDGSPTAEPDLVIPDSGGGEDAFTWGSTESDNQDSSGGYYDTFRSIQVNDRGDSANSGSRNQMGPAHVGYYDAFIEQFFRGSYSSIRAINNPAAHAAVNTANFGDAPVRAANPSESDSGYAVEVFYENKAHQHQGFPGSPEGDHSDRLMQWSTNGANNKLFVRGNQGLFDETTYGARLEHGVTDPADNTWSNELAPEPVTVIEPGETVELTWNVDVSRDENGNRTDLMLSNRDDNPLYSSTWWTGYTVFFTDDPESIFHGSGSGMSRHDGTAEPIEEDTVSDTPPLLPDVSEWSYYHIIEALVIERDSSKVGVYNQEIAAYIEHVVSNSYNVADAREAYAAELLNQFPGIPADSLEKFIDIIVELAGEIEEGEDTLDLEQLTSMMPPSSLFSNFSAQIQVDNSQSLQAALNGLRGVASSEFGVDEGLLTAELWNDYVNEHGVVDWVISRNPALDPDFEPEEPGEPTDPEPGEYTVQDMLNAISAEDLRNDTWGAVYYVEGISSYEELLDVMYSYLQEEQNFPWMTPDLYNEYIEAVELQEWHQEVHVGSDPGDLSPVETMIATINERTTLVPGDFSSDFYLDSFTQDVVSSAPTLEIAKANFRSSEIEGYYQVNIPSDKAYEDFLVEIKFEAWYTELTGGGDEEPSEPVDMQSIVNQINDTDQLTLGDFDSEFYQNNNWIVDGATEINSWMLLDLRNELSYLYGVEFDNDADFDAFVEHVQFEAWVNHVNGGNEEPSEPVDMESVVEQISNTDQLTVGDFDSEFYQNNNWIVAGASEVNSWMLQDLRNELSFLYGVEFDNDGDFDAFVEYIQFEAWFNHVNGGSGEPEEELSLFEAISAQDQLTPGDFESDFYQNHSWLFYGEYSEWILEDLRGELAYYYGITINDDDEWAAFLETIEFDTWYYEVTGYHPDPEHSSTWGADRIASDAFGYTDAVDMGLNTYEALQATYDSAETTQAVANEAFYNELLDGTDFSVDDFNSDQLEALVDIIITENSVEWVDPLVRDLPEDPAEWTSQDIAAFRAVQNDNESAEQQVTADTGHIDTQLARSGTTTEDFFSQESTIYNEMLTEFEDAGLSTDQLNDYLAFLEREQLLAPNWSYEQLLENVYWNYAFTDNSNGDISENTVITTWGIQESDQDAMSTSLNDGVTDIGWYEVFTPFYYFLDTTLPGGFTEAQMDEFISEMTARNLEPQGESTEITGGNNMSNE